MKIQFTKFQILANNARMSSEEARTIGESYRDDMARQIMFRVADGYEKIAMAYEKMDLT